MSSVSRRCVWAVLFIACGGSEPVLAPSPVAPVAASTAPADEPDREPSDDQLLRVSVDGLVATAHGLPAISLDGRQISFLSRLGDVYPTNGMAVGPFDLFALDWIAAGEQQAALAIVPLLAHTVQMDAEQAGCEGDDFICDAPPGELERLEQDARAAIERGVAAANERLARHRWRSLVAVPMGSEGIRLEVDDDQDGEGRPVTVRLFGEDGSVVCEYRGALEPPDDEESCRYVAANAWRDPEGSSVVLQIICEDQGFESTLYVTADACVPPVSAD